PADARLASGRQTEHSTRGRVCGRRQRVLPSQITHGETRDHVLAQCCVMTIAPVVRFSQAGETLGLLRAWSEALRGTQYNAARSASFNQALHLTAYSLRCAAGVHAASPSQMGRMQRISWGQRLRNGCKITFQCTRTEG